MAKLREIKVRDIAQYEWQYWVMEFLRNFKSYIVYGEHTQPYKDLVPEITGRQSSSLQPDIIFKRSGDKGYNLGEITISKNIPGYWRKKLDWYMDVLPRKALTGRTY